MDAQSAGVFALLDFLMGSSIDDVMRSHRFVSRVHAEAAIRAALLVHGYDVRTARSALKL